MTPLWKITSGAEAGGSVLAAAVADEVGLTVGGTPGRAHENVAMSKIVITKGL
jgi:adenine/guanine phosphoribosyltransferase-like PRPP-binding protein